MKKNIFGILFLILFSVTLGYTARPFGTDDTGTVDQGKFELELGYNYLKPLIGDAEHSAELGLVYGVTERLDLGIVVPYSIAPDSGHQPAEVGIKYTLILNDEGSPVFSLTFGSVLGSSEYGLNTIYSHEFSFMNLHLNLGLSTDGTIINPAVISYAGFFEFPVKDILTLGAEIMGEAVAGPGSIWSLGAGVGAALNITDSISWDLGCSFGLIYTADFTVMSGFTFAF